MICATTSIWTRMLIPNTLPSLKSLSCLPSGQKMSNPADHALHEEEEDDDQGEVFLDEADIVGEIAVDDDEGLPSRYVYVLKISMHRMSKHLYSYLLVGYYLLQIFLMQMMNLVLG